jgi:hypothetical protein
MNNPGGGIMIGFVGMSERSKTPQALICNAYNGLVRDFMVSVSCNRPHPTYRRFVKPGAGRKDWWDLTGYLIAARF